MMKLFLLLLLTFLSSVFAESSLITFEGEIKKVSFESISVEIQIKTSSGLKNVYLGSVRKMKKFKITEFLLKNSNRAKAIGKYGSSDGLIADYFEIDGKVYFDHR